MGAGLPTVRQVAHRAREHVRARRKRHPGAGQAIDPKRNAELTAQFLATAASGDVARNCAVSSALRLGSIACPAPGWRLRRAREHVRARCAT
ncbi:hypothetical protein MAHJHV57_52000 [Mycobacterium avium subsp. hominissuis]